MLGGATIVVKKLDYRYNYYKFYSHVLIVSSPSLRRRIVSRLTEMYGPRGEFVSTGYGTTVWKNNENFRYEESKKRIFVKNPEDVTLLTLTFSQHT